MIGSFGTVIFEVSDEKVLTFGKLSHTAGAKFADISLISGKSRKQYVGAELRTVSLDIKLRANHGVKPRTMIETLQTMTESGVANHIIIGGRPLGELPFVIQSMSAEWGTVFRGGELFEASVSLSLEEYR